MLLGCFFFWVYVLRSSLVRTSLYLLMSDTSCAPVEIASLFIVVSNTESSRLLTSSCDSDMNGPVPHKHVY